MYHFLRTEREERMNGLGTLLILGIVMYFLFSRKGAVGCCGGHSQHGSRHREPHRPMPQDFSQNRRNEDIIDLKPEDYKVISERPK